MPAPRSEPSPLRGPLLAGLGAACAFIVLAGALSVFAGGEPAPAGAAADIAARPDPVILAEAEPEVDAPAAPFDDGPVEDVTLPGVADTEAALTAPPAPERPAAPRAPLPGLYEDGPGGPLPVIGADGQRPDAAYARAHSQRTGPVVALIVGGLGMSERLTLEAIETLPPEVTLSFAPYARDLQGWIDRARAAGHEVLIELPMEPFDYPNNDPGPHTLLAEAGAAENERRLTWLLSRAAGYTGVINYQGARLGASQAPLARVLARLEARGLTVFHDGAGRRPVIEAAGREAGARLVLADRVIDSDPGRDAVEQRLLELEALALQNGAALGSGFAYPVTVEAARAWAEGLSRRGYVLAPASHVAKLRHAQTRET
ncbi:divergent polysaccharide deacetylase family protein [Alkalicaulis satelles]|uniref:Divergent polysaccharide deacetylase family protein n=1 Tax=Alkalicaulis satelles TaxID=2609175 RepID=A0A5M6ZIF5_9PROT|nr:divergent polysaccharide deacetylase family protein [Alkalicaulis satelles]KAA5803815.1 divergent polysaccharide deacetylase family protein [Alkalicaulis satelles]